MSHCLPSWLSLLYLQMILINLHFDVVFPVSSWSCTSLLFCQKVLNGVNSYQHISTWSYWLWYLEWKGSYWKHIIVGFVVAKFMCVVAFVSLLCWCFTLEFVAAIVCTITLKVGSSAPVELACLHYGLNFINTWCIWGAEFGSWIVLCSFIPCADIMNIPEAILRHLTLCALRSYHTIFQLPTVETIDYCIVVSAFAQILDMSEMWYILDRSSLTQCK